MSILQMMMAGLSLEYEGVITSGDCHLATRDGEAMFFIDGEDLSGYAGNDVGYTPYRVALFDVSGYVAIAYGGAAGGGEALGSELVVNGNMESGDPSDYWTSVNSATLSREADERTGGSGSYCVDVSGGIGLTCISQTFVYDTSMNGKILRVSAWGRAVSGSIMKLRFSAGSLLDILEGYASTDWGNDYSYITPSGENVQCFSQKATSSTIRLDDISAKPLTDIPATGLHLMSTKNGTTRNMASVETGFDHNAIVGVKIYG